MDARAKNIRYAQHRLDQTLLQADAADGECAKASHVGLADLYRADLVRLNAGVAVENLPAAEALFES